MFDSIRQCFYEAVGGCDPETYGDTAMYVQAPSHDEDVRAATDIIRVLQESEKAGKDLENQVAIVMGGRKWTETLAKRVLEGLEKGLKAGMKMGESLKDAFDRAVAAAVDFAREHPVYTTIIAIGILVVLLPWVIEALGFAKLGPVEGTFAAWWQSRYLGYVPKGSLFAFFQRLGMIWKHKVVCQAAVPPMTYSISKT